MFQSNITSPSSGLKTKPCKKPAKAGGNLKLSPKDGNKLGGSITPYFHFVGQLCDCCQGNGGFYLSVEIYVHKQYFPSQPHISSHQLILS
jgi:hypothetical protein